MITELSVFNEKYKSMYTFEDYVVYFIQRNYIFILEFLVVKLCIMEFMHFFCSEITSVPFSRIRGFYIWLLVSHFIKINAFYLKKWISILFSLFWWFQIRLTMWIEINTFCQQIYKLMEMRLHDFIKFEEISPLNEEN